MLKRISPSKIIFIFLFVVFFFTASGSIDTTDTTTQIVLAKRIITQRKINFSLEEKLKGLTLTFNKKDHEFYSVYNFGYAFMQIPGVLASLLLRKIFGVKVPDFPYELDVVIILYASFLNAFIVSFIGAVMYKLSALLDNETTKKIKLVFIIPALVLSTNLFAQAHMVFSHPAFTLFFLISLYYLTCYIQSNNIKKLYLFSLFFAVTASVYNTTFILFIPAFYVYIALSKIKIIKNNFKRFMKMFISFTLSLLPAFLVQFAWNYLRFKNILASGYLEEGTKIVEFNAKLFLERLYGLTFSTNKGIFINNPILIISLIISVILIFIKKFKHKPFVIFYLTLLTTYLFVYSNITFWHGDSTYGPRYLTPLIPVGIVIFLISVIPLLKIFEKKSACWKCYMYQIVTVAVVFGFIVQIPGILIPHFTFLNISPEYCREYNNRFYNWKCAPIKTGLMHIARFGIKQTLNTLRYDKFHSFMISEISYPFPLWGTPYYPRSVKLPLSINFKYPKKENIKVNLTDVANLLKFKNGELTISFYINDSFIAEQKLKGKEWNDFHFTIPGNKISTKEYNRLGIKLEGNIVKQGLEKSQQNQADLTMVDMEFNSNKLSLANLRTIYPDPLLDKFSKYKTYAYHVDISVLQEIYNQTLDIWWLKYPLYKNIFDF